MTDETGWSINSVWAFLSEKARLVLFGVHKDSATLRLILDPATFMGTLVSDDAAVYAGFSHNSKRRSPDALPFRGRTVAALPQSSPAHVYLAF